MFSYVVKENELLLCVQKSSLSSLYGKDYLDHDVHVSTIIVLLQLEIAFTLWYIGS